MKVQSRNFLVILLGFIAAIGPFSIDTYLPAFSAISKAFATDEAMVTLTLTSYFIGITIGQLFYGPLMDKFGRKTPMLVGFSIYIISALGCALSSNIEMLIFFRFTMALGGCAGIVSSSAIIRDNFGPTEFAKVMSSIILVMGVAPVIAPSLGSWIITISDWRSIFYFLAALVTVVVFIIFFFYKDVKEPDSLISLKFKSVFKTYGQILQNKTFTLYSLARGLSMSVLFAYLATISFILMDIYKVSNTTFGWMFGLNALGFISGSQINKLFLKYVELEKLTFNISILQTTVVAVVLVFANFVELPITVFSGFIFVSLFFVGIINPNTTSLALAPFDKNAGSASALTGSMLMGIGAIVSAAIGKFYNGTIFPLVIGFLILCSLGCLVMFFAKQNSQRIEA